MIPRIVAVPIPNEEKLEFIIAQILDYLVSKEKKKSTSLE
jgi:hypothetical protein